MRLMSIQKKSYTPKCGLQLLLFYIETGTKVCLVETGTIVFFSKKNKLDRPSPSFF